MTKIIHIWMLMHSLTKHPKCDAIHIWMLRHSLNKHPKCDDKNHPHLDDFGSLSSYIGNNHHKASKIGKPTLKNIQFWMKQRGQKSSTFGI